MNNKYKTENFGNLGTISFGIRPNLLKKDKNKSSNILVKFTKWSDLKNIVNKQDTDNLTSYEVSSQQVYRRNCVIKKGNIILNGVPSLNNENIIYIDEELDDIYICSDNMFIFKNQSNYPDEYIYLILKSGLYDKFVEYAFKHMSIKAPKRLNVKILKEIEIPILDDMTEIVKQHQKLQNEKKKIIQEETDFNNKIYELTKRTLNY